MGCDQPWPPRRLIRIGRLKGTHKNFWNVIRHRIPCFRSARLAYVADYTVYDLSDPGFVGFSSATLGSLAASRMDKTIRRRLPVHFHRARRHSGVFRLWHKQEWRVADRPSREICSPVQPHRPMRTCYFPRSDSSSFHPRPARTVFPILGLTVPDFTNYRDAQRDFVLIVNESLVNECAKRDRWHGSPTSPSKSSRRSCPASPCRSPAAISAGEAAASARIHPTKT